MRNSQTDRRFNNATVVIMICTWTKRHKGAVAGHVGACKWGVGAQANRVGSQLPPAPSSYRI